MKQTWYVKLYGAFFGLLLLLGVSGFLITFHVLSGLFFWVFLASFLFSLILAGYTVKRCRNEIQSLSSLYEKEAAARASLQHEMEEEARRPCRDC